MSEQKDFPKLTPEAQANLIRELTQYSLANGLIIYPPNFSAYQANLAPVTLYPTPLPRSQFEKSVNIATEFNQLYSNIVVEKKWLLDIIDDLSKFDADFTGKLYKTYLQAKKNGIVQPVSLGLFRSDYMLDTASQSIKQIEFNTVSVSFGGLSAKVGELHNFLNAYGLYVPETNGRYYADGELPISESNFGMAKGLYDAVNFYQKTHTDKETIVLFVVQPNERNAFDQRAIEYTLFKKHGVRSRRVDLTQATKEVTIDKVTKKLYYKGDEVSVVYYRSAYGPQEFEAQEAWDCRLVLESTLAIKCPSLLVQLSGAKKIQQLLTDKKIVDQFLPSTTGTSMQEQLMSTFVRIYPLDDTDEGKFAKSLAFESPEKFVLKPQREGGGNNIYKDDIPSYLKALPEAEWAGYILMEIINPPIHSNQILRNGEVIDEGVISELGIFGSILFNEDTGDVINNDSAGHLLRSKTSSSNEGGVAAGFGCVDSLYLY